MSAASRLYASLVFKTSKDGDCTTSLRIIIFVIMGFFLPYIHSEAPLLQFMTSYQASQRALIILAEFQ